LIHGKWRSNFPILILLGWAWKGFFCITLNIMHTIIGVKKYTKVELLLAFIVYKKRNLGALVFLIIWWRHAFCNSIGDGFYLLLITYKISRMVTHSVYNFYNFWQMTIHVIIHVMLSRSMLRNYIMSYVYWKSLYQDIFKQMRT
jgi:hypothetical protein